MKQKESDVHFDHEADQTLVLLDELPKVKARTGFYDRLNYRMELEKEQDSRKYSMQWVVRKLRVFAASALVAGAIFLGVFIGSAAPASSDAEGIETLISTYGISVPETPGYFSTENNQS